MNTMPAWPWWVWALIVAGIILAPIKLKIWSKLMSKPKARTEDD